MALSFHDNRNYSHLVATTILQWSHQYIYIIVIPKKKINFLSIRGLLYYLVCLHHTAAWSLASKHLQMKEITADIISLVN